MAKCTIPGCGNDSIAKGYCTMHYKRIKKHGDPNYVFDYVTCKDKKCVVEGCQSEAHSKGYCNTHYYRLKKYGNPTLGGPRVGRRVKKKCSVDGCDQMSNAHGLCSRHYSIKERYGDPLHPVKRRGLYKGCLVEGCDRPHAACGLCRQHYSRLFSSGNPLGITGAPIQEREKQKCSIDGCDNVMIAKGLCNKHYSRVKNHGTAELFLRGERTGTHLTALGYREVLMPSHKNAKQNGFVKEHILVMSEFLGRPIEKGESIHHINGIRDDNRIENLELWSSQHPPGQRIADKILHYTDFLEKHGYTVSKR